MAYNNNCLVFSHDFVGEEFGQAWLDNSPASCGANGGFSETFGW